MVSTAIAFIVFNRPDHTAETFAAIRKAQPRQLLVIADGPRPNHPTDAQRCAAVREIVAQIDWDCDVQYNLADRNLGCKRRVSSGLDWVFDQVDRAIILEDDCLPHPSFFDYCDALLDRYSQDDRVWAITGNNFQEGQVRGDAAYYFARYFHCWGWATWRRAWKHYRGDLPFWPDWKTSPNWAALLPDPVERRYWTKNFERVYHNTVDSWAYAWLASIWYGGGLTATPNVNLVRNIGFDEHATHTRSARSCYARLKLHPLGPLTHPQHVAVDQLADAYVFEHTFGGRRLRWPRSMLLPPRRFAAALVNRLRSF